MNILSFAFGFMALAIAAHFTDKKWIWLVSGIGTFILSAIAVEFEIVIIPILFLSLILLIELYLLIERFLKKH
jgi:hypothetical protein